MFYVTIVDSDPADVVRLKSVLERFKNIKIENIFTDGKEAMDFIYDSYYFNNLVITNTSLPGVSGRDFIGFL